MNAQGAVQFQSTSTHTHTEKLHICSYIYTSNDTIYTGQGPESIKWDKMNYGIANNIYNIAVDWLISTYR